MSGRGQKAGGGSKPAAARPQPKPAAASKGNKPKQGAGKKGAAADSAKKRAFGCFVKGCPAQCADESSLAAHYEAVFSTNEDRHVAALAMQLDPHFSDETSCQICGDEFVHTGLLLKHIFAAATAPGLKGVQASVVKHSQDMHAQLFQSFVQELCGMQANGQEEVVEYLLSLAVPDYDPDEEDDDEDAGMNDDGAYEDEEPDDDEIAEFQDFLAMQGIDIAAAMGGGLAGMGGDDDDEEMGGADMKRAFMKQFMQGMGMNGGMDDDEDEDEERGPRAKKGKGKAAGSKSAASAAAASSTNPGDLECESCSLFHPKSSYSAAQLKKKGKRRCKDCIGGSSAGGDGGDSAAASPAKPQKAANGPAAAAAAASSSSARPAAASASASAAAASTAAQPASKPSAARASTLHQHHAASHRTADGKPVVEEEEDWTGQEEAREAEEHSDDDDDADGEDDEDEEDEDEEDEDDDETEWDPFQEMFGGGGGGGGGRRRGGGAKAKSTAASSKEKRAEMQMYIAAERPGQQLSRDRRLRLKPSSDAPVRSWQPKTGEAPCSLCKTRTASRVVGWKLCCLQCALKKRWVKDEEAPDHDDDDEHQHHHSSSTAQKRAEKIQSHSFIALQGSRFPNYRPGMVQCVRSDCRESTRLLVVYDEVGDEWVFCVKCKQAKQKLRYCDHHQRKMVDALQEPITQHD